MGYLTPLVWMGLGPEGGTPLLHGSPERIRGATGLVPASVAYFRLCFVLGEFFALKNTGKCGC
jgi:hypothetical protein